MDAIEKDLGDIRRLLRIGMAGRHELSTTFLEGVIHAH